MNGALAILSVHLFHTFLDKVFAIFKAIAVVVANDVRKGCVFNVALYAQQMIEALIAFGGFGGFVGGQHGRKLGSQTVSVYHLAFSISRMHTHTFYMYFGRCGIKVFILKVA